MQRVRVPKSGGQASGGEGGGGRAVCVFSPFFASMQALRSFQIYTAFAKSCFGFLHHFFPFKSGADEGKRTGVLHFSFSLHGDGFRRPFVLACRFLLLFFFAFYPPPLFLFFFSHEFSFWLCEIPLL